jgi:hypothetical protein
MEGIFALFFFGTIFIGLPYLFFWYIKREDRKILEEMPEQTFKVNVAVVPIEASGMLNFARGRALTHNLEVQVHIGLKDWDRIKRAGLYDAVLFEYPDPTSASSGEMREYYVRDLKIHGAASFYDLNSATNARETLLNNIVNLRASIEIQKEGKQVTEFEL